MSKKGTIINEWEKLTAPSNRRLKYQSLTLPLKMQWSIDRITIVGKLKENIYYHTPNDVLILNFEQLMRLNEGNGYLRSVSNNGWQLLDQHEENIAGSVA
ncbi:replication protein, partial [Enterococcus faecium]|nr:replication protein [Enterococcus faecium]